MYDAALAGISDRESSLDSIFNDNKIYVNSFYTEGEDKSLKDISKTTEQYLCQFLIPRYFLTTKKGEPSLQLYNKYLEEIKVAREERLKVIATLKDFVVYLTYRSNGAPRKLSSLIEQYIKPLPSSEINGNEARKNIIIGSNDENVFLVLGFYNQYKFSLISYLTSPIFLGIGNYIHEYSDKLLVSISYMLDHLFKHHKFGLSYRSLSLTPEIVDINKEPQFREFLDKLISFLSKNHLRPIVSGIYDFKFHGKIQAEIKFLSKIDEQEAAAFNFTLDESIELKRHFNKRLESLKEKETIINGLGNQSEEYINNIALLHMMIGDLHFNDEEFHESIVHYMDAIQVLRQKDVKKMTLYEFVVFVRNNLKLGLAFEKNKMFDSALMTFSELTDLILRKQNIPLRELGLARFIIKKENLAKEEIQNLISDYEKEKKITIEQVLNKSSQKEIIVFGRLKESVVKIFINEDENSINNNWKRIYPIEDMATFYGINSSDFMKNIESVDCNYRPLKTFYIQSTGESVRVLYQSLIAKLHLIEKSSPDRLKSIDLIRAIKEFNFLKFPLKTAEKRIIVAEFYNKIGDLLFFKNGTLNRPLRISLFKNIDCENESGLEKGSKLLLKTPLDASFFYIKSLAVLLIPRSKIAINNNEDKNIINLINYYERFDKESEHSDFFPKVEETLTKVKERIDKIIIDRSFRERYTNDFLLSIANGILDLAECLCSFTSFEKLEEKGKTGYLNPNYIGGILKLSMHEILNLYHYASVIFEGIGEYRLARSQKIKILYTLNQCSTETCFELVEQSMLKFIGNGGKEPKLEDLVNKCNQLSCAAINNSNLLDNKKLERIFYPEKNLEKFSISNIEFFEAETIYSHIVNKFVNLKKETFDGKKVYIREKDKSRVFKYFFKKPKKELKEVLDNFMNNSITPNNSVGGKNNRLLILSTLVQYNKERMIGATVNLIKSREFLILNSLGACHEIIKIHNLFGLNYITTSNFGLAKAHYQMAFWCSQFRNLKDEIKERSKDSNNKMIENLEDILMDDLLDSKTSDYINEEYHYKLALEYNNRIIDFHSRGTALQDFLKPYSYLDDFYNDNFVHFSVAIERNKYQEGIIDLNIKKINEQISNLKNLA